MKNNFFIVFIFLLISNINASELFKPLEKNKAYNKKIINLGRELFFDTMLSKNNDISCNSCHNKYGADNVQYSKGDKKLVGMINTPSLFNLNHNIAYFWNGRSETLKEQLLDGPIFNKHEMANDKHTIEERLKNSKKYHNLFKEAYNESPSFEKLVDALVEYEKTLLTLDSKFDRFLREEVQLNEVEKKGMNLFISYGCVSCHNGINIGGNSYQKFGAVINYEDNQEVWIDRFSFTKNEQDKNIFRVPSLRNIAKTAPYFHDGSVSTLKEAIYTMGYYNTGAILNDNEILEIESFLKTLTGDLPETYAKGIIDEKD